MNAQDFDKARAKLLRLDDDGGQASDLLQVGEERMRKVRGDRIAMIFQDPMTSLNPYLKIGEQLGEVLELHRGMSKREARDQSVEMLRSVGIPAPISRACVPGGQSQFKTATAVSIEVGQR